VLFLANVLQLGFFPFACPIFTPYGMALPWTGRFGAWGKRGVWALGCGHLAAPPGPHLCPMAMVILGQTHTKPPGDLHWVAMRGISTRHSTSGTHGGHTSHLPPAPCAPQEWPCTTTPACGAPLVVVGTCQTISKSQLGGKGGNQHLPCHQGHPWCPHEPGATPAPGAPCAHAQPCAPVARHWWHWAHTKPPANIP